jgi:hypothetical protein
MSRSSQFPTFRSAARLTFSSVGSLVSSSFCWLSVSLLLSLLIALLPAVYIGDLSWPGSTGRSNVTGIQRAIAAVVVPPNLVAEFLGFHHLEYIHLTEAPSGSLPPHEMSGCECRPEEVRAAFLAAGWPFWFVTIFGGGLCVRGLLRKLFYRSGRPE